MFQAIRLVSAGIVLVLAQTAGPARADILVTNVDRSISVDLIAYGFSVPGGLSFHQTNNGPAAGPWTDAIAGSLTPQFGTFSATASQDSLVSATTLSLVVHAVYSRSSQPSRPLLSMEGQARSGAGITFTVTTDTLVRIDMDGATTVTGPYDYGSRSGSLQRVGGAAILSVNEGTTVPVSTLVVLTPGEYSLWGSAVASQNPAISFNASSADRVMSVSLTVVPSAPGSALLLGAAVGTFRRRRARQALRRSWTQ